MANLGKIEPNQEGRWLWPFKDMQPGDWFQVDPAKRPCQSVRGMAHTRGCQLGKRFRITESDADAMIRVECVDPDVRMRESAAPFLRYDKLCARLIAIYGVDQEALNTLGWNLNEIGVSEHVAARALQSIGQSYLIADAAGARFHIELAPVGFKITRVAEGMTYQQFAEECEAQCILELMR